MSGDNLKPCPFCGAAPTFPEIKDAYGTQYEGGCEECGIATVSIQIIDCFDYEENPTRIDAHDSWNSQESRFGDYFISIARNLAISEWNIRHNEAE